MSKRQIDSRKQELIKELITLYEPKSVNDVNEALKEMFGPVLSDMMNAEIEDHLGYSKYSHEHKDDQNRRNGSYKKTVKSTHGNIELDVPRDREGTYEPLVVPKGQRDISEIEEKIISMYGRGLSQRDISFTIEDIYGFEISHELISNVTDKIMDRINEWQNRPLEPCYPFVFVDCMYVSVKNGIKTVKKALYTILGYDLNGHKDILGIWIGEGSESAHYWAEVFDQIKSRGVEDIFFVSMDGLSGLQKAVETIYPEAMIQRCIVHLVRNALKYVPTKDYKEFTRDLKSFYGAISLDECLVNFEKFKEKWKNYNGAIRVFESNFNHVEQLFQFTKAIRKTMYTTNAIESVHAAYRKVTNRKGTFPNDKAVIKLVYLRTMDLKEKWTNRTVSNWPNVLNELLLIEKYQKRIEKHLI